MIEIVQVDSPTEFETIENLANEIMHEVYALIIPAEHTTYFLQQFQSIDAIANQIKNENFSYFLLKFDTNTVGYLGIQKQDKTLILSKIYILAAFRGLKIGKAALEHVNGFAANNRMEKVELIVNQQNQNTIDFYLKDGFKITESITNSFPNGHSVQDYKMVKTLAHQ